METNTPSKSDRIIECKLCHAHILFREMHKHRLTVHGLKATTGHRGPRKLNTPATPDPSNPLDKLRDLQVQIQAEVKRLSHERDLLHRKLCDLDTLIAKYNKMLIANCRE